MSEVDDIQAATGQGIKELTICLALTRGKFGNRKKADLDEVRVDSDKELLSMSKQLLESPELKAIQKLDSEVSRYMKSVAFKSLFKGGIYLLPIAMSRDVVATLEQFKARRAVLVDAAVETYPLRIRETSSRLAVLQNEDDYPSKRQFAESFTFAWRFVTFDTPTALKRISAEIFEQEQQKQAANLSAVADECRGAMRVMLSDMVARLVERLTPDEGGDKKKFTRTAVTNIHDFLETFSMRNVTNDEALAEVVAKAREITAGADPKLLRSDDAVRAKLAQDLEALQKTLAPLVVEAGARSISFEDEV